MTLHNLVLEQGEHTIEITEDSDFQAIFIGKEQDSLHTRLNLVHRLPHLKSRINIKAVVYDAADFDLEANLIIEQTAFDTDTYLKIDALVVGEQATARAVPSLEIKTDNVKGGHGATIGQLDQEQIYYLQARGIDIHTATELLIESFLHNT